jgi:hypothetical protein
MLANFEKNGMDSHVLWGPGKPKTKCETEEMEGFEESLVAKSANQG